jgi:hypothetical protein
MQKSLVLLLLGAEEKVSPWAFFSEKSEILTSSERKGPWANLVLAQKLSRYSQYIITLLLSICCQTTALNVQFYFKSLTLRNWKKLFNLCEN